MCYAIADLGSNTIRLSVYRTQEGGGFERLFSEKEMAGLVGYVTEGTLSQEGIQRACEVLQRYQGLLDRLGLGKLQVVATAPLRNIRNTDQAVETIRRETGLAVEVLSGGQEAKLSYLGAMQDVALEEGGLFDLGGGSTEVVAVGQGEICRAQSIPLGSLNLFQTYVTKIWPKKKEIHRMEGAIRRALEQADLPRLPGSQLCGVGGTARAAVKLVNCWKRRPADCRSLTWTELEAVTERLLERDQGARKLVLRVCPDRVHTILPGILLLREVCRALEGKTIQVSHYGVREGYLCHKVLSQKTEGRPRIGN